MMSLAARIGAQSNATVQYFTPFTSDSFRVHLKVICKNVPLGGLTLSQFTFKENSQQFNTVRMLRSANTSVNDCYDAALVINRSSDMNTGSPRYIDQVKSAAKKFIDNLRPSCDKAALISFGSDVSLDAFLSNDKDKMKQQIDSIRTGGGISMWDAAYLAMIELQYNGSNATRSVIIFTNGDDNSSSTTSALDVISYARQNNISVHIIGIGSAVDSIAMKDVTIRTGGRFFYSQTGSNLEFILSTISAMMRDEHLQYQFEYKSQLQNIRKRIIEITANGCDVPLTIKIYYDAGAGINPPAPFLLNSTTIRNTDLFRIDHTGCNVPNEYALDTLRLRWQTSAYSEPFMNDTITYYWNAILDSAGTQNTITILSDNQGKSASLTIDGLTIYDKLFRRANLVNPDSLVIRVPWFVKAVNQFDDATYSDTAGVTKRIYTAQTPSTPPFIISINRKPDTPTLTTPPDSIVITNINDNSVINLTWKFSKDINTSLAKRIGGFMVYNTNSSQWINGADPAHIVDTLTFQNRIEVIENFPKNRGVAIGTTFKVPAGTDASANFIYPTIIKALFNDINNPTTRVDSVRIKWMVDVKDFHQTNGREPVTFDSLWSGVGCRPHISTSDSRTILLIRGSGPTSIDESKTRERGFYLSQNYPNPFTTSTTIEVRLNPSSANQSPITLKVYDLLGREVLDLSDKISDNSSGGSFGQLTIGNWQLPKAGVYIYRLQNGNEMISRKMILIE